MKNIFFVLLLACGIGANAQIQDTGTLRNYINSYIVPNGNRTITAQQLNNVFNGFLNLRQNFFNQGGNSFGTTAVFGTIDSNHLDFYSNNVRRARLSAAGNLLIGQTVDNGATLQVNGWAQSIGFSVGATAWSSGVPNNGLVLGWSGSYAIYFAGAGTGFGHSWRTNVNSPTGERMRITDADVMMLNSNTMIGTTADNGNTFQVNGSMSVSQSGANKLYIPSGGCNVVFAAGGLQVQSSTGTSGGLSLNGSTPITNTMSVSQGFAITQSNSITGAGTTIFTLNPGTMSIGPVSGTNIGVLVGGGFYPGSGTATHATLQVSPVINQTGGANGTTWGLYINPTLTSATSWRALEVTNGNSYLGSMSGNTILGALSDNGQRLQVNGQVTATGFGTYYNGSPVGFITSAGANGMQLYADPNTSSGSVLDIGTNHVLNGTTELSVVSITPQFTGNSTQAGVNQSMLLIAPTYNITVGATDNGNLRGIYYNPTLTGLGSGTPRMIAWENVTGTAIFGSTSGDVLIGTTTDAGSKVDISATYGYNQLRLRTEYTPTSSSDANGNPGDTAVDDNYFYYKTSTGWKRTALSTF